jgi:RNA-binding protein YlmH
VAGEAFNLARGKVQTLIGAEKAQVNWNIVTNTSHQLKEGDLVSVRGFGRFRLLEIGGKTKKDRTTLVIEKYI